MTNKSYNDYLEAYQKLHAGTAGYLCEGIEYRPSKKLFDGSNFVKKLVLDFKQALDSRTRAARVLDYGCGKAKHIDSRIVYGQTLHELFKGKIQTYYCYDPGFKMFEVPPAANQRFDIIICADVMEHIPGQENIMQALQTMANHLEADGVALFTIAGDLAKKQFVDGENLHVSIYDVEQWAAWLTDAFGHKHVKMIYDCRGTEIRWSNLYSYEPVK